MVDPSSQAASTSASTHRRRLAALSRPIPTSFSSLFKPWLPSSPSFSQRFVLYSSGAVANRQLRLAMSLTWIFQPRRVQRADGTPVLVGTSKLGFIDELRQIWSILKRPEVLTLYALSRAYIVTIEADHVFLDRIRMPLAFYSSLFGPWTGTYLSLYFSVRARCVFLPSSPST
jgi:hypothetical protein